jgi:hypothetical protein
MSLPMINLLRRVSEIKSNNGLVESLYFLGSIVSVRPHGQVIWTLLTRPLTGGPETTSMARLLGPNAHLVSYGAMSKKPLSLPTSQFIFKNLTSHGFWQSRWYGEKSRAEREELVHKLAKLMSDGTV